VLLTNTCGIAPLIHKRAGLAVPLGIDSLVEGLRVMLNTVDRDQFLVGRDEVKREMSWEEPLRLQEQIYRKILARQGSRRSES
jgi:hypothetical protein